MLQDLAFDAVSSFSTGLKLSICKGGFHTGSFSYCGKLPFQLFLWGSSKMASLWPSPFVSACWPPEEEQAGNGQAEFKQGDSSHCGEEDCGALSAEGQAGWGKKNRNGIVRTVSLLSWGEPKRTHSLTEEKSKEKRAWLTKLLFLPCQAFVYCTHLQLNWVSLSVLLKPEFKTCGGQYCISPQTVHNYQINFRKCKLANGWKCKSLTIFLITQKYLSCGLNRCSS